MNIQLQTELNEIIHFVNKQSGLVLPRNNMNLQKWSVSAKKLRQRNPAESYIIEALVYRLQGQLDKALECIKKAYNINTNVSAENYAILLISNGLFTEATEMLFKRIKADKADISLLYLLLVGAHYSLNKELLMEVSDMFKSSSKEIMNNIQLVHEEVDNILSKIKEVGVSPETYTHLTSNAIRIKNKNHIGYDLIKASIQTNEIGTFLLVHYGLSNVTVDDCLRLNDELLDVLIDDDYPFENYSNIIFEFCPEEVFKA